MRFLLIAFLATTFFTCNTHAQMGQQEFLDEIGIQGTVTQLDNAVSDVYADDPSFTHSVTGYIDASNGDYITGKVRGTIQNGVFKANNGPGGSKVKETCTSKDGCEGCRFTTDPAGCDCTKQVQGAQNAWCEHKIERQH